MDGADKSAQAAAFMNKYKTQYQVYLDKVTPHLKYRWGALGGMLVLFFLRVIYGEGWYVVCYGLSIYLLNQFLAFLTPKFDVSLQQDEENNELEAGERADEFRPFIRRLPEFKFWHNSVRAVCLCSVLTLFRIFDIPVFWPILVVYFVLLFALTMRRQIQHMIKYRYIPLDIGKKRYRSRD
ncbi:Protein RER1 [Lachancea thermotolerans]